MANKFRPILPANTTTRDAGPSTGADISEPDRSNNIVLPKPKRSPVYTACNHCRKRKIKCDGKTPACTRCVNKRLDCEYDIEPDVSRQLSLKRKYEFMQDETSQLKELYRYLHNRPESEAIEILRRIRTTTDPLRVLRFIKEGDLLIQGLVTGSPRDVLDPRARRLDDEALESSPIKLRAKPWTAVAHDGVVSELVSSFLEWDQTFYFSFIHKECFLNDFNSADPQHSTWCSPLLVNSICALKCFTSDRSKEYGLIEGIDLHKNFYQEAQRLLDLENGKATISTVQALLIMYVCSAGVGRDRAGIMYRCIAYEMLQRLELERRYERLGADHDSSAVEEQGAISRLAWGVFCFESISAFAYLKPSLVRPPSLPKRFASGSVTGRSEDLFGNHSVTGSHESPTASDILTEICHLSEIMYEVMATYENRNIQVDSVPDIEKRWALYGKLLAWKESLPPELLVETNPTPQTIYLRMYQNRAILGIFRPLDRKTTVNSSIPTAGRMCVNACREHVKGLKEYESRFGFQDYSILTVYSVYDVTMTLVSRLDDDVSREPFTVACRLASGRITDFPFVSYLFTALWVLSKQLDQNLPAESIQYVKSKKLSELDTTEDIPIGFILPHYRDTAKLESESVADVHGETKLQIGNLISRWNAMSLS